MVIYLLVTKFLTVSEEQNFLLDSIVDLLLTQKLTNLKVLQLQSDYFHDKVIICSSNSVIQMNYGNYKIIQIHGVSGFCFKKKLLNTKQFENFFLNLPIKLLFIDDDMLSYFLYINKIKIYKTLKKINRNYLSQSDGLIYQSGELNRGKLRKYATYYTYQKYKKKFPFNSLI